MPIAETLTSVTALAAHPTHEWIAVARSGGEVEILGAPDFATSLNAGVERVFRLEWIDETLVAAAHDRGVVVLDVQAGRIAWVVDRAGVWGFGSDRAICASSAGDGKLFVSFESGNLLVVDRYSRVVHDSKTQSPPLAAAFDGTHLWTIHMRRLEALDPDTLQRVMSAQLPDQVHGLAADRGHALCRVGRSLTLFTSDEAKVLETELMPGTASLALDVANGLAGCVEDGSWIVRDLNGKVVQTFRSDSGVIVGAFRNGNSLIGMRDGSLVV